MKALTLIMILLAGLWFSACKSTPTPTAPSTPQPQTSQTPETPPAPSSETQKPDQAGAPPASKTSRENRPEGTEAVEQVPTKKEQTPKAASQEAEKSPPTDSAQKSQQRPSYTPATAEARLEKAREDLRISEATEQKIAAELKQLKESGQASTEDIRNYEIYHERVQEIVAENRKKVEQMERAYRQHTPEGKMSQVTSGSGYSGSGETIPEEHTSDQVAELDRQLTASLSQFDTMLLKEMETIENESAAKTRDLAQEAAEAARRLKEKGVDLGTEESESSDEASKQGQAGDTEASAEKTDSGAEQGDDDGSVASSGSSKGQGSGPKDKRGSRYSKEDDDIVARQLREAAENETDPELKEKLWKEYEDYKKNTR